MTFTLLRCAQGILAALLVVVFFAIGARGLELMQGHPQECGPMTVTQLANRLDVWIAQSLAGKVLAPEHIAEMQRMSACIHRQYGDENKK
jgi:hypothetical protein